MCPDNFIMMFLVSFMILQVSKSKYLSMHRRARVCKSMFGLQWCSLDPNLLSLILAQMLLCINIYFPTVSSDSVFLCVEETKGGSTVRSLL